MTAQIRSNVYGKAQVRVARIDRSGPSHIFRELVVQITLDGDFAAAHTAGDNRNVLPTDSMKNTVHAFAHEHLNGAIESFGRVLAGHFVDSTPPVLVNASTTSGTTSSSSPSRTTSASATSGTPGSTCRRIRRRRRR